MKKISLVFLSFVFSFFTIFTISAQNKSFNLNDISAGSLKSGSILGKTSVPLFQNASKSRELDINPIIQNNQSIQVNDTIQLDLFENKQYKAYIDKTEVDVNGTSVIRARLVGYEYGSCIISTYKGKSFMTVEVPEKDELYLSKYDREKNKYFLLQIDKSKQKVVENVDPITPPDRSLKINGIKKNTPLDIFNLNPLKNATIESENIVKNQSLLGDPTIRDTITLMIVFTPSAAAWSSENETDINNTIGLLMEKSQLALDNSNTLITLKLVYTAQVNYTELNNDNDLYNLTEYGDGMMEDVHSWRDAYCADVVVLLENIEFTGGLGWVLNSTSGLPNFGFSLSRVQQVSSSYTTIHEIAHNIGCHHPKSQSNAPGPGIFPYSAGWRWAESSGVEYCTVMTSPDGKYFPDGIDAIRIPYFSSPDIQFQGMPIGDVVEADNARTLREMKHVVASYRSRCSNCTPPTVQANSFKASLISGNSMVIDWKRGNGNSVLVVASQGNPYPIVPENGKGYPCGSNIGNGNYVVYNGIGTSGLITGLTSGTTYHFSIYEYNSESNCYLMPALTGNATTTGITPSFQASQWTWQNPYPQGNPLYSVKYISTTEGWAVGESGTIMKTTDGGTTWNLQTSGTMNVLLGVSFTDANNGTIVGDFGTILRTTDGGANWSTQSSGTTNALYGVIFTDVNKGTAVGYNGTILRTNDGGTTWTAQLSGINNILFGVSFIDANNGIAVGDVGTILLTTNGGNTWSTQSSGTTNRLFDVSFIDINNGTAVGTGGTILKTTNGGSIWTQQSSGTTSSLFGVSFINDMIGTAVGEAGSNFCLSSYILSTIDGGTTWTPHPIPGYNIMKVSFYDKNNGIAVGGDRVGADLLTNIFITKDGGKTWTDLVKATTGRWLNDVAFADANNGIAVGIEGAIIATNNGGISWTSQISGTRAWFQDVSCIDAKNWIAVGNRGAIVSDGEKLWTAQVCRTSNGGKTWIVQSFPPTDKAYAFTGVAFTDANNGIIVGGDWNGTKYDALILKTSNGGLDWIKQQINIASRLQSVYFSDINNGIAVGDNGTILKTNDGGTTWTQQVSGTSDDLLKVFFIDSNNGTVIGFVGGIVLRTTNGGINWTSQHVGIGHPLNNVYFSDANNGTIVGVNGLISKTKDGGATWTEQFSGTKITLNGVYFFDNNNGIIVGQGGAIIRTTGSSCPLPDLAGTITGKTLVCQGESALIYSITAIPNSTSYKWSYSGKGATIGNSKSNSIFINFSSDATSGELTVQGHNDCGDGVASTVLITVNPLPQQPIITQNDAVLHSTSITGNQWYNNNGLISGATSQDFTPKTSGDYYLVVSDIGCNSEPSSSIHFIPTGINPIMSAKTIKVYPNPTSNELTIEIEGNTNNTEFEILNSIGQVIFTGTLVEKSVVQTTSFTPGIYLVKLKSGDTFEFKKVLKK